MKKKIGSDKIGIDISIIIVSYNTKDLTVATIKSVINTVKKSSYEIIVVDNNSSDDSVFEIKKLKPNLLVIENKENLGFSKANNIGVKKSSGRYVLFLNSDTVVYENTIDGMIEFMDNYKDAGAATCYLEMPNGKMDDASHRGFPTPWRAFCHFSGISKIFPTSRLFSGYSLGYLNLDKTHEIEALAGAFMLVRREAGEKVGWWDEDFFWYGDDLDFCYRLKENGYKIYFVPEFKILHYKGASGGIKKESNHITNVSKETRLKATNARFEAMELFYKKHYMSKYSSVFTRFILFAISIKWKLAKFNN